MDETDWSSRYTAPSASEYRGEQSRSELRGAGTPPQNPIPRRTPSFLDSEYLGDRPERARGAGRLPEKNPRRETPSSNRCTPSESEANTRDSALKGRGGRDAPQKRTHVALRCLRGFAVITALSVLSACHGESVEARRSEAGHIAEAVRVLRAASSTDRRPLLKALEDARCTGVDLCDLKKTCVEAYSLEQSALDGLSAVRHSVEGTDPVPTEATALLARSESDLRRAAELGRACADREGEARRRYSL